MSLEALTRPFAEEEIKSFRGAGGKELTYVEDEQVMDRLDEAFGMGNWQVHVEAIPYVEGVVKVSLAVRIDPESEWISHEDFGYPNNKDGQALKESVSDGIRRCGRYLGIARDLYRKDTAPTTRPPERPSPPQRPPAEPTPIRPPAAAPARSSTDLPEGPELDWDVLSEKKPEPFGTTAALARDVDGTVTTKELFDRADSAKVPMDELAKASKKLFGTKAWKVKDLTDVQRYAVAIEVGLA